LSPQGQPSPLGAPRADSVGERTEQGSGVVAGCQNCGDPRAMYVRYREEKLGANLCSECDKAEMRKRVGTNE